MRGKLVGEGEGLYERKKKTNMNMVAPSRYERSRSWGVVGGGADKQPPKKIT